MVGMNFVITFYIAWNELYGNIRNYFRRCSQKEKAVFTWRVGRSICNTRVLHMGSIQKSSKP